MTNRPDRLDYATPPPRRKRGHRWALWLLVGVAAFAILLIAAWFMLRLG